MKIFHIYFFLYMNFVATVVAYYRRCNASFSLCLITNTTDYRSNWNNKFQLTRSAAEIWCRSQSSTLASITNETVQSAMEAFVNDPSAKIRMNSFVLTNGYRLKNLSNWEWINGGQSDYFVESIDPDVGYGTHRYAYLVASTNKITIFDSHATNKRKFICSYITQNSSCSYGSRRLESSCYKLYRSIETWFDARNICLKDGSDLATFENGIPQFRTEWGEEQFWIGMRKEKWYWWNGQEMKYSNWNGWSPSSSGGDCLCLSTWTGNTGKWTNCHCSYSYRYVCIQGYASNSTSTVKTSTIQMTTTTKNLETTQSMTTSTPTLGDSSSMFNSTTIPTLDDDSRSNVSDDPPKTLGSGQTSGFLPILVGGIACLLILIVVIALVVCIKIRRGRSGDHEPANGNSPPPMTYKDDAPNTVYAAVVPNSNEPVCSASEKNSNQTVYAELDLEPKRNIGSTQRASNPGRFRPTPEKTPSQAIYAEVNNCLPQETMNGRPEDPSEYDNIQVIMDSVYANSAQTKV